MASVRPDLDFTNFLDSQSQLNSRENLNTIRIRSRSDNTMNENSRSYTNPGSASDVGNEPESFIFPSTTTMIRRLVNSGYNFFALPFKINAVGQVEMADSFHSKAALLIVVMFIMYSSFLSVRLMFKFNVYEVKYLWYLLLQIFSAMATGLYINTYIHRHDILQYMNTSNVFYQNFKSKCQSGISTEYFFYIFEHTID